MAIENTSFLEIIFRNLLIGITMYDEDGTKITIDELNYDPIIKKIFVTSGENTYKLNIDKYYDFEMDIKLKKIISHKTKIKGKRNKK
jgi:hypothetical protein